MPGLILIWIVALIMMAVAVLWMCGLIAMRLVHARAAARRDRDRRAVIEGLSAVLREAPDGEALLKPHIGRGRLMAEALLEFQGLIRGADQDRVVAVLKGLGLEQTLTMRIGRGSLIGRLSAVEGLAALGGESAQAALRRAVFDPRPEIRMAAVKGLADTGAAPTIGRLLDYAVGGELPTSRVYAELVRQVTAQDPPAAALALRRADLPPDLRALVLDALGMSGDYGVAQGLIEAAAADELEVRTAGVRALGRLQHPAGEATIAAAMHDSHWVVRAAAAEAAGASGFDRLCPALAELLGDEEWWVRFRAGEALAKLGREGVARLQSAARSRREVASRAAGMALLEHGAA